MTVNSHSELRRHIRKLAAQLEYIPTAKEIAIWFQRHAYVMTPQEKNYLVNYYTPAPKEAPV